MHIEKIELKLLKKVLTKTSLDSIFGTTMTDEEILGIYIWGSRLWGTDNNDSDLDYCIIVSDSSSIWRYEPNGYFQRESEDIDLHIMSETRYKKMVQECDEMALSVYFQENPLLKYEYKAEINLQNLRKSFSSKANNSYVKAKKKLTVEEGTQENFKLAYKSMYHSLRLLDFGTEIALLVNGIGTGIYNFTSYGENFEWVREEFIIHVDNWEHLHELFRPIYNNYASEFKKLAPKG